MTTRKVSAVAAALIALFCVPASVYAQVQKKETPAVHVVAIGINHYTSGEDLRFAEGDAQEVFKALGADANTGSTLIGPGATSAGVEKVLDGEGRRTKLEDSFVLFFSGRGAMSGSDFCFFTAGRGKAGSDECLPANTLWAWLQRIPAKHLLLILDTGDASGFLNSISARVTRRPEDFADRDIAIIAPQGDADENEDLHHGAVTNAVLKSIRNRDSDLNGDGYLSVAELQAAFSIHWIKEQRAKASGASGDHKFVKLMVLPGLLCAGHDFSITSIGDESGKFTDSRGTRSYAESNPPPVPVLSSHYYALVIGVNEYQKWPKLRNPVNDAKAVGKELFERFGFHVTPLIYPERSDIIKALTNLKTQQFSPDDELFIFFAGHGTYDDNLKTGYLAAIDSKPEKEDELHDSFIDENILFRLAQGTAAKHVFVVIDACQSGAQFMNRDDPKKEMGYEPGKKLETLLRKKDRPTYYYMTSGGNEYVPDGEGIHSPFANQLLRALSIEDRDGIITLKEVMDMVDQMPKGAPQPIYGPLPKSVPASEFWLVSNPSLRVEKDTQK